MQASRKKKQVTVLIELKARFDEHSNIDCAKRLEKENIEVVYGFVGLKVHSKTCLIVRQEEGLLQSYVHLSTGNYNPSTAKHYTDLGLFTCHPKITEDISLLFNFLTGTHVLKAPIARDFLEKSLKFKALIVAPFFMRDWILTEITKLKRHKKKNPKDTCLLFAKMNNLVDKKIIEALYEASQAGVKIRILTPA